MKKITFLLLLLMFSIQAIAQVLNQPATWPNANWSITGTFVPGAAFEADPTVTANFGYDDDEAGSGSTNNIAAESPVIDLTAAFNAGETWLFVNSNYVYNNIGADRLAVQYWNADTSTWLNWGTPLAADTPGAPLVAFCAGTFAPFDSGELNIAGFTPTQLSGFRYRIRYDDGGSWAWGFCFQSPTLTSEAPPTCPAPTGLAVANVGGNTATISWSAGSAEMAWGYVIQPAGTGIPTGNGDTMTETTINETTLDYSTPYEVYVRADCNGDFSDWIGPLNFTTTIQTQFTVDCAVGPITDIYCYGNDIDDDPSLETFVFTSTDGSPLRLTFNSGLVESCCDELVVIDTDGTQLYNATVPGGILDGLEFQSSGDTISYYINSDISVSCESGSFPNGINYTVSCATCVNPVATFAVRGDCLNAPQFFIDVNVSDLGSAGSLTLTDNQGGSPQNVSATGLVTFGPYPIATNVQITVANDDDGNCIVTSPTLTQPICLQTAVDCAEGPYTDNYCYGNDIDEDPSLETFVFTSTDGSPLRLTFNSGLIESCCDELVVIDTDGTQLFNATVPGGVLDGLEFQSSGDTISYYINSDISVSCESGSFPNGINYTVSCATCVNPTATYAVRSDCINGPQFFVDVDITDLGSATSLTITDNQGSTPETVTAAGLVSFGPYTNATDVQITVSNDDDVNCSQMSNSLTQPFCLENFVDCAVGPVNSVSCYDDDGDIDPEVFVFTSTDGTPLNITFNSGNVEWNAFGNAPYDPLIVLDSDGVTQLYNGGGNVGDLAGLTFQSTGGSISYYVESDFVFSCQSSTDINPIDVTVSCATCINPAATYTVIDDCATGDQFLVDVNVTSLGDAGSVTITDNQGSPGVQVSTTGVVQFGPYPFLTPIVITVSNDDDVNCVINSTPIELLACPPANDNCDGAIVASVNPGESCGLVTSGTILAATPSGVPSGSCAGNPDDDVWFQFTALGEQQIIQLQNFNGGTTNIDHAVYSGTCGNLVELYCSSDDFSLTPNLTIGNTYFIRVFSAGSLDETTSFDLCIQTLGIPQYCLDALPICADAGIIYPSIVGNDEAPSYIDYDCLGSVPDPTWNAIYFDTAGNYTFALDQTGTDGIGNDIDFIVWGPFNGQEPGCYDLLPQNVADCSYSPTPNETVTLNNVQEGDVFIILITNFSEEEGTYTFVQETGPTNGTNCEIVCDVVIEYQDTEVEEDPANPGFGYPIQECGLESITLTANSPYADYYEWYQDGFSMELYTESITVTTSGFYQVLVNGDVCDGDSLSIQVPVTLGQSPVANPVADLITCDDASADGFASFDLESQTATILGSQDASVFTVTYHTSLNDANSGTGALTSPYTNITNPQTIWVRIADANAAFCIDRTTFDLVVSGPTPIVNSVDYNICDDGSNDGFASFDLISQNSLVLGTQNPADFNVSYYLSEADANAGVSPLGSPYTNATNPQTIWVRIESNVSATCYGTGQMTLTVSPAPTVTSVPDIGGCDADGNGIPDFDLTTYEADILGGQTGMTVTYHTSQADADGDASAIGNPSDYSANTPTTIFVRVESGPDCYNTTSFDLVDGTVPVTTITTVSDEFEICDNATVPLVLTAVPGNYSASEVTIVWYQDGGAISGENGLELSVLTGGLYEVEVTFNSTGCTDTVSQEVEQLDNCIIPQGISPDGDGKNDTFDLSNFSVVRIEIFNRNGTLVYSKDNYTNEWFGQTDDGEELPVGTYFYSMIYEGGAKTKSSWIYINR